MPHIFWGQKDISAPEPAISFLCLESYFKIGHRVSKLMSVEMFDNISKLQSNITIKWPADI